MRSQLLQLRAGSLRCSNTHATCSSQASHLIMLSQRMTVWLGRLCLHVHQMVFTAFHLYLVALYARLQLDEVRRQSGGRQHLPAVPEEDEVYAEHTDHVPAAPADNSATAAVTTLATNPPEASTPPLQDPHQRPAAVALPAMQQPASHLQHAVTPPAASKQGYAAAHQKQADQNQSHQLAVRTVRSNQALQQRQHGAVQLAVSQTNLQQRHKSLHPSGSQPDARHARKGAASNASSPGGSSPSAASALDTKRSSPGSSHAVEHSSVSLSQLALASRSKLRAPSSLSSPPKRGSRAAIHKQATHNHLASLAANVPLPASPVNDAKEPPAVVALATAVAKPSHIPAPVGKPSRLKKPTNTSGFFSSGRSFTNAQRYLMLLNNSGAAF